MENFSAQPVWRVEPHLYCDFAIMHHFIGQYKTFLARVDNTDPILLFGGSTEVKAKFDNQQVKAEDRAKLRVGKFVQIIAKVLPGFVRIVHLTIMPTANVESLLFRNRVAQLLHEVLIINILMLYFL